MKSNNRYAVIQQKLAGVAMGANLSGACLVLFYFSFIDPATRGLITDWEKNLSIRIIIIVAAMILGMSVSSLWDKSLWIWYQRALQAKETAPAPLTVRQLALNLPAISAGTSLGMWILVGLVISFAYNPATGEFDWASFSQVFFGTSVIAGFTTTAIHYLATERVWQNELPLFFGEDKLISTSAFRLSVRNRLLIMFILSIVPLLLMATLAYNQAVQMANSPQPLEILSNIIRLIVFLSFAGVLTAITLAIMLRSSLVQPLEMLGKQMDRVQAGNLDERVKVTSNDEIGELATHFNSMINALQRREVELQAIYEISTSITANIDLEKTMRVVLDQLRSMIPYDRAAICLYDDKTHVAHTRALATPDQVTVHQSDTIPALVPEYITWMTEHRASLLLTEVDAPDAPAGSSPVDGIRMSSFLGTPLVANQKLIGVMQLFGARKQAFDEHARQLLETIVPQAATTIGNALEIKARERRLQEQIQQLQIEVDQAKQSRQVAEITETDFFQQLAQRAEQMRGNKPQSPSPA